MERKTNSNPDVIEADTPASASPSGSANRGYCYERVKHNPREAAFAAEWERENEPRAYLNFGHGILQDLFFERVSAFDAKCVHVVTDRERYVTATAIQWLGSNCGMAFLEDALSKCGYKLVKVESQNGEAQPPSLTRLAEAPGSALRTTNKET